MTVTVYTFEDEDGCEDTYTTFVYADAKEHAARHQMAIIANEYEWSDSEMVDDFRPQSADADESDPEDEEDE